MLNSLHHSILHNTAAALNKFVLLEGLQLVPQQTRFGHFNKPMKGPKIIGKSRKRRIIQCCFIGKKDKEIE